MNHETLMAQGPVECRVRLCRDCKHSTPEPRSEWNLLCGHPEVNRRDPWMLSGANHLGTSARTERDGNWRGLWRTPCGMRGALWEPNAKVSEGENER
jgi:hypothetical protein